MRNVRHQLLTIQNHISIEPAHPLSLFPQEAQKKWKKFSNEREKEEARKKHSIYNLEHSQYHRDRQEMRKLPAIYRRLEEERRESYHLWNSYHVPSCIRLGTFMLP